MQKISYVMLLAVLVLSACTQSFKKGKDGLEYKIISKGNGDKLKVGDFMQIHVAQYYATGKKDSLMTDTRTGSGPMIEVLDSVSTPPAYFEILSQLKKDDSLIIRILTDSAFAKSPESMPPFFKKGHYLTTTVKVVNIFKTREQADSARKEEMVMTQKRDSIKNIELIAQDDKTLTAYFAKNNIKAVKAPLGTYVETIQPGTGANIDTSVVVLVNYTGKTLDGKIFDSNTDPAKGHMEPLSVNMTNDRTIGGPRVITGMTDGMLLLNKGAKAKFYIPSTFGYGAQGAGADIAPNSILVFDIEVVDVLNKEQARAEMAKKTAMLKERQQKYVDSLKKVQADTLRKK